MLSTKVVEGVKAAGQFFSKCHSGVFGGISTKKQIKPSAPSLSVPADNQSLVFLGFRKN